MFALSIDILTHIVNVVQYILTTETFCVMIRYFPPETILNYLCISSLFKAYINGNFKKIHILN